METKICSNPNCIYGGKPQPITNFYKDNHRKSGYNSRCKTCVDKKNREYALKHQDKIADYQKEYANKNKDRITEYKKLYYNSNKSDMRLKDNQNKKLFAKYDVYYNKLSKYEECRQDPDNPELLQVRCKNHKCKKWFNPTNQQVVNRLKAINGQLSGNRNSNNYLYCSQECKDDCPVYRTIKDPVEKKSTSKKSSCRTNNMQEELRELVLERDNYTCQKCGRSLDDNPELQLICHHIIPIKVDPSLASDMDNCQTLCEDCHKEVHKIPGCALKELAEL